MPTISTNFFLVTTVEPKALAWGYESSLTPHQKFLESPPKSFFKSLLLGTSLGQALQKMSASKAVPEGLKSQECEKGNCKKRPPIPYVPVVDEVQEAVKTGKEYSYKIKLPDKTEFSVPIWDTGTPESFLIHMQQAKSACKRKGLFQDYEDALEAESKAEEQAKSLRRAIASSKKKGGDEPGQTSQDDLKAALKEALLEKKSAEEVKAAAAEGFFSLYANLLSEDARFRWDKIVTSQVGTAPWTDLKGNEHVEARGKSMESFQDCINFHLLDMFPSDAAERQRFYISNVLKKPQRVPVRYFFQRVEQLNGYLAYLPCTYYSPRATAATKPVAAFDEAELANLLLRMCPESWQDQYDLTQDSLPQSVRKLLSVLENVEKVVANSDAKEKAAKERVEKTTGKRDKGKRKGTNSNEYRIPKKVRVEKSCALCQKHGGAHTTHNTGECRKYEKDGTLKKSFISGKPTVGKKHHGNGKKESANSFAQVMERFAKLEKAVKRANKGSRKKKRRQEYSDSSDSDSE